MRGRWAAGIVPRNFTWVIQDRLAVCERPGGYSPNHRKVRRQEEILWINGQRFSRIISLLPSTHNLHAYEERNLPSAHFPLPTNVDVSEILAELYPALLHWLRNGERLLMHQEELGERVAGVIAGFLCWSGVLPEPPRAISAVEQLFKRQMGTAGRTIVALSVQLPPPPEPMSAFKSPDSVTESVDKPREPTLSLLGDVTDSLPKGHKGAAQKRSPRARVARAAKAESAESVNLA